MDSQLSQTFRHLGGMRDTGALLLKAPLTKEEIANGRKGARARRRNEKRKRKQRRNKANSAPIEVPQQDGTFFFIAGYTEGGFPYGTTWEENEQMNNDLSLFETMPPEDIGEDRVDP